MDADYLDVWKEWSGKDHVSLGGYETVKVKFKKNGYIAEVSEAVAGKLVDKGAAELVKKPKEKEDKPEPKKEAPKKQAVKK